MLLVGNGRGAVLAFDQEKLRVEETLKPEQREALAKGVALPKPLRAAIEGGQILVVGHDLADRWTWNLRARGLSVGRACDTKKLFIYHFAAQPSYCQTRTQAKRWGIKAFVLPLIHVVSKYRNYASVQFDGDTEALRSKGTLMFAATLPLVTATEAARCSPRAPFC